MSRRKAKSGSRGAPSRFGGEQPEPAPRRAGAGEQPSSSHLRGLLIAIAVGVTVVIVAVVRMRAPSGTASIAPPAPASNAAPSPPGQAAPLSESDRQMFAWYETSRAWTRPALVELVKRELLPLVDRPGARVIEIGAGTGELFELVNLAREDGRIDPAKVAWTETDKYGEYLQVARKFEPSSKRVAVLPQLAGLPDASATHIVGLSVFPVLPVRDLAASMRGIGRVLEPGGLLAHVDDLGLTYEAEAHHVFGDGLLPLPYFDGPSRDAMLRPMRVVYIDRRRLEAVIGAPEASRRLSADQLLTYRALLRDPVSFVPSVPLASLYGLEQELDGLGVLRKDLDSRVADLVLRRLTEAATAAGLQIVRAEEVTASRAVDRSTVPGVPPEATEVRRRYTVRLHNAGSGGREVRLSTAALLFIARKPAVGGDGKSGGTRETGRER